MRLSTPTSRRLVMLKARAVNVVESTLIPAIPGTITFRSCWLPWKIAPKKARNSSGSRKLKKAELGLRQNSRRSSRYWRQVIAAKDGLGVLGTGGDLQVDVLERGAADGQALESPALGQRLGRELVEQLRRVVRLALDEAAVHVAVGDEVAVAAPERPRGALDDDSPRAHDGHAVGQGLGLVEVVGGEQDGLAQGLQRADRLPGVAPRARVEAGRGLVEEDQLGVADQGEGEVQAAQLPAREPPRRLVGLLLQAGQGQDLVDVAGRGVERGEVLQGLAHADVAVDPRALQDDPHPPAQLGRLSGRVDAEHAHLARGPVAIALEDLHRGGLAGAVGTEEPEDLPPGHGEVDRPDGLHLAVALGQPAYGNGRIFTHGRPIMAT